MTFTPVRTKQGDLLWLKTGETKPLGRSEIIDATLDRVKMKNSVKGKN